MKKSPPSEKRKKKVPGALLASAENPIPKSTFGDIGAFRQVRLEKHASNVRIEIPYTKAKAQGVDEQSLRLFRWDVATRSLVLHHPSGVDVERRRVWGIVREPGLYGAIGLPRDPDVARTVAAFALFSAEQLRAARGELIPKVCGLILCVKGGGPPQPHGGTPCKLCLGIEVPLAHLPEVQILLVNPKFWGWWAPLPPTPGPPSPAPPVWPTSDNDYRNNRQSSFRGPARQPSLLWEYDAGGKWLSLPVVGFDGTVYLAERSHQSGSTAVLALDGETGQVKWSSQISSAWVPRVQPQPVLDARGRVCVNGADNGDLVVFNAAGAIEWRYHRPGRILSWPVPGLDGRIYVDSEGEGIIALDANGQDAWAAPFADSTHGFGRTPIAARDDGTIIVTGEGGGRDHIVWALDSNAQVLWTKSWPSVFGIANMIPTVAGNGRILVATSGTSFPMTFEIRVLSATGRQEASWTWPYYISNVVAQNGTTYVWHYRQVAAVDVAGAVVWQRSFPGIVSDFSLAVSSDGTVYVGTDDQEIHALDPATGNDLWVASASRGVVGLAIGLGGTLLARGALSGGYKVMAFR